MLQNNAIEIIHASQLDKSRWDFCVQREQALIYSYSWYLDAMADDWYGLVVGDYEAVMALPVKRKLGIKMMAMPAFLQRLDIAKVEKDLQHHITKKIETFSKLIHFSSSKKDFFENCKCRIRTNFILDLTSSYESIFDNYSDQCKKNLRQAARRGCILSNEVSINEVLTLYRMAYETRTSYTSAHYYKLSTLLEIAQKKNMLQLACIRDEKNEMVYSGLLLDDGSRLYYLLGAPTEKGRQMRATYFFMDAMINRYAGYRKLFDFEGSDIPDVATFYQSFSPQKEHYYEYYINRYPFPLNRLLDSRLQPF